MWPFSRKARNVITGVNAMIAKEIIVMKDWQTAWAIAELAASSTAGERETCRVEITVKGFDDNPRPLVEIPAFVSWCRVVQENVPDICYWLTPGSLLRHLLCVKPECFDVKKSDPLMVRVIDERQLHILMVAMLEVAKTRLTNAGLPEAQATDLLSKGVVLNYKRAVAGWTLDGGSYKLYTPPRMRDYKP